MFVNRNGHSEEFQSTFCANRSILIMTVILLTKFRGVAVSDTKHHLVIFQCYFHAVLCGMCRLQNGYIDAPAASAVAGK